MPKEKHVDLRPLSCPCRPKSGQRSASTCACDTQNFWSAGNMPVSVLCSTYYGSPLLLVRSLPRGGGHVADRFPSGSGLRINRRSSPSPATYPRAWRSDAGRRSQPLAVSVFPQRARFDVECRYAETYQAIWGDKVAAVAGADILRRAMMAEQPVQRADTLRALSLRATRMAKHSPAYSSITHSIRSTS